MERVQASGQGHFRECRLMHIDKWSSHFYDLSLLLSLPLHEVRFPEVSIRH